MVLYALYHGASLAPAIIHRLQIHPTDRAILLVGDNGWHIGNKISKEAFLEIFDQVVLCKISVGEIQVSSVEEVEQKILNYFDDLLLDNGICLSEVEQIYNLIDGQDSFGIYLAMKKIKFNLPELYNDFFYIYHTLDRYENYNSNEVYTATLKKYKCFSGHNDFVTPILLSESYNPFDEQKIIKRFDYINEILNLSDADKRRIKDMYSINDELFGEDKYNLFLPSSSYTVSANFKQRLKSQYCSDSIMAYHFCHQLFLDLVIDYAAGKVLFKPHPSNTVEDSERKNFYNGIEMINSSFPSQFLRILNNIKVDNIFALGSTSTNKLNFEYKKGIYISNDIYIYFDIIIKLYISLSLKKVLFNKSILTNNVTSKNMEDDLLLLANGSDGIDRTIDIDIKDINEFVIEDDVTSNFEKISEDRIVICLNSYNDYSFLGECSKLLDDIIPIIIKKTAVKENVLCNLQDETVYVLSNNPKIREKVRKFSMSKTLKYAGIELNVFSQSVEQNQLEIMKLQVDFANNKLLEQENRITELENMMNNICEYYHQFPGGGGGGKYNYIIALVLPFCKASLFTNKYDLFMGRRAV